MDTGSFIINIKTEDFYEDIANDVDERFDTSTYECDRPLPTGKKQRNKRNKKNKEMCNRKNT